MASLAARDQENLVNARQTAAASKPLNQGLRGLQSKPPGTQAYQTPFKTRIRDENVLFTSIGAKNAVQGNPLPPNGAKGKQGALVTPAPTKQMLRNALAPKTTNAKAKNPGLALTQKRGTAIVPRSGNRPPSLQKVTSKALVSSEFEIPVSAGPEDAPPSSPEVEYTPPKAIDLPDIDPELPPLDLSGHKARSSRQIIGDLYFEIMDRPRGPEGLSRIQMEEKHQEEVDRIWQLREEAKMIRNLEAASLSCLCEPECVGGHCKEWAEQKKTAEENYQKATAGLLLPHERGEKEKTKQLLESTKARTTTKSARGELHPGPSDAASKGAANALSMQTKNDGSTQVRRRDYPRPWLSGSKPTLSYKNHEGHTARHAASVAASRTTLGFRKGRVASADIRHTAGRETIADVKTQKTETEILREMWMELERREEEEMGIENAFAASRDVAMEDAQEDFVLEL